MELEWKKFSEEMPDQSIKAIWTCNGDEVYLQKNSSHLRMSFEGSNHLWAKSDIVFPPVPNKKMHLCSNGGSHLWICFEDENGFFLKHTGTYINVKFCPFCGYEAKR